MKEESPGTGACVWGSYTALMINVLLGAMVHPYYHGINYNVIYHKYK